MMKIIAVLDFGPDEPVLPSTWVLNIMGGWGQRVIRLSFCKRPKNFTNMSHPRIFPSNTLVGRWMDDL